MAKHALTSITIKPKNCRLIRPSYRWINHSSNSIRLFIN